MADEEMPAFPNIGVKLRGYREAKGLTLRQVATVAGVSNPTINLIETGKVKRPTFQNVMRLCKVYGIKAEDLS